MPMSANWAKIEEFQQNSIRNIIIRLNSQAQKFEFAWLIFQAQKDRKIHQLNLDWNVWWLSWIRLPGICVWFSEQLRSFKLTVMYEYWDTLCLCEVEIGGEYMCQEKFFSLLGTDLFFQLHKAALCSYVTHSRWCTHYAHNFQLNKILTAFPRTPGSPLPLVFLLIASNSKRTHEPYIVKSFWNRSHNNASARGGKSFSPLPFTKGISFNENRYTWIVFVLFVHLVLSCRAHQRK